MKWERYLLVFYIFWVQIPQKTKMESQFNAISSGIIVVREHELEPKFEFTPGSLLDKLEKQQRK